MSLFFSPLCSVLSFYSLFLFILFFDLLLDGFQRCTNQLSLQDCNNKNAINGSSLVLIPFSENYIS